MVMMVMKIEQRTLNLQIFMSKNFASEGFIHINIGVSGIYSDGDINYNIALPRLHEQ